VTAIKTCRESDDRSNDLEKDDDNDDDDDDDSIERPSTSASSTTPTTPAPSTTTSTTTSTTSTTTPTTSTSAPAVEIGSLGRAVKSENKILICHANSPDNYVLISINKNGLKGHEKHKRDITPAPGGGCPVRKSTTSTSPTTSIGS
jgi:hypothetical protein